MRTLATFLLFSLTLMGGALGASAQAQSNAGMRFLPGDIDVVGSVDLAGLRGTDTWRVLRPALESFASQQAGMPRTGAASFQSLTDDAARFSFGLYANAARSSARGVFVAEGNFNVEGLTAALVATPTMTRADLGTTISFRGPEGMRVALYDASTLVMGSDAEVAAAVDRVQKNEPARLNADLQRQMHRASQSRQVWIAARVTPAMRALASDLNDVRGVVMTLDLSQGLRASISLQATEAVVGQMATEFAANQERLGSTPELAMLGLTSVVRGLSMRAEGDVGTVDLQLAATEWNRLVVTLGALLESELR